MTRRLRMLSFIALASVSISACTSTSAKPDPTIAPEAPAAGTRSGDLPPQTLAAEECGMFLWTATEPRRFIFFSKAQSRAGKLSIEGVEVLLAEASARGDLFGQFMTETVYKASDRVVTVTVAPGETIEDGQRISGGKITLQDADGWETIIPVLGLRACQSAAG